MAIKRLEIKGYRSIDDMKLNAKQIMALIGPNGSGKSNILSALYFFYRSLTAEQREENIFDANNKLRNEVCIRVTYDLQEILKKIQHNLNGGSIEYEKYYTKILAIAKEDEIVLELIKRKEKRTIWNQDYNIRQIISFLFPIYFVDSREIMLTDWHDLWGLIGDLVKLRHEDSERLQGDIRQKITDDYQSMDGRLRNLVRLLEEKRINVKKMTPKQLGEVTAEIAVGGRMFQYGERSLQEYSNGTNAYNYTVFLINILNMLKRYKLKEPIIVLDEPEISLHYLLIDELMEKIFVVSDNLQFFLSTHSARCVKALLESEEQVSGIYHIVLSGQYTKAKRVKELPREASRERAVITEAYTNSCFAKMVLNVEGSTEQELFRNKYLRLVFPTLKEVEIANGMSNQVIYNLTAPHKRNYQIPGFAVMDMDKVLEKKDKQNRFLFKKLKDYPIAKETFHFGEQRGNALYRRKRIERMCEKCNFFFQYPFFSYSDENFVCLLDEIKNYYENYHVFLWRNTVEGALITAGNLQIFLEYMKERKNKDYENLILMETKYPFLKKEKNQLLNYVRLLFSGKSDYLLTKKKIKELNPQIHDRLTENMNRIDKTGGWVSDWLEFYFLGTARRTGADVSDFSQFRRWLETGNNKENVRDKAEKDFVELHQLHRLLQKNWDDNRVK